MARKLLVDNLIANGVRGLQPYVPGKPSEELEREIGLTSTIKLASNENPLGPSESALAAIRDCLPDLALYPDGSGHALKQALAAHWGIGEDRFTLGNGSNDVLVLLAEAFLAPGQAAVFDQYSFVVYRLAVQATGAESRIADSNPPAHAQPLGHDLEAIARLVDERVRLVFIANPNNPTGTWADGSPLRACIASLPHDTLVVVDEAYGEYVDRPDYVSALQWLDEFPNLVVTRTFSKIYGLAGLRVGYAVSHPDVAEVLNRIRQPFNVNSLAQQAAIAALKDDAFIQKARRQNSAGLDMLRTGLADMGVYVVPSIGNFVLADFGRPALPIYNALLEAGLIVRPVANYGLENHLRISVGLPQQNERLLDELRRILKQLK